MNLKSLIQRWSSSRKREALQKEIEAKVPLLTGEVSQFFGCPEIEFEAEVAAIEKKKAGYQDQDGKKWIWTSDGNAFAQYLPEEDKNRIKVDPDQYAKDPTHLELALRHEITHGLHNRSNQSISPILQDVERYRNGFRTCLLGNIFSGRKDLSPQSQGAFSSYCDAMVKTSLALEAVAYGYTYYSLNLGSIVFHSSYDMDLEGLQALERMATNLDHSFSEVSSLKLEQLLPYLNFKFVSAYRMLNNFAEIALFQDLSSLPSVSVEEKDDSSPPAQIITLKYEKPLSRDQAGTRLKEWFCLDGNTLAERLIGQYRQQVQHVLKAANELK